MHVRPEARERPGKGTRDKAEGSNWIDGCSFEDI